MSNRKSSITAELKLAGASGFKSGLAEVGTSAKKLGRDLQAIKPITFDGGANQAKQSFVRIEEHQRAHLRVLERQNKQSQLRMQATGIGGGSAKGGRGNSYGLAVGYNAIQDLVQGGPAAIANNIPQIIELVAKSPMLKVLGVAAAAAAAGYAAVRMGQYAYSETEEGNAEISARNYEKGRAEAESRLAKRKNKEAAEKSKQIAAAGREAQENYGGVIDQEIGQIDRNHGMNEGSAIVSEKLQRTKLKGIQDAAERVNKLADEEKKAIQQSYDRNNTRINTILQIAAQEEANAKLEYDETKAGLDGITTAAKTPNDINLENQLTEKMIGVKKRMEDSVARLAKVQDEYNLVKQQGIEIDLRQAEVDEQRKNDLADIAERQKEIAAANLEKSANKAMDYLSRRVAEDDKKAKKEEKAENERKEASSDLSDREAMSKMSPRALAKFQEKKKLQDDTDRFIKLGINPEEAAKMAGREQKLAKPRGNRIRGAGYGGGRGEDSSGLGSATYGGLDDLEAMQPAVSKERKAIKGAGHRDKEKKSGSNDNPDNLHQVMVKGFAEVVKAVRDTGPNATDRAKPSSSN